MNRILKVTLAALTFVFYTNFALAGEGYRGFSVGIVGNDSEFTTTGREEERGSEILEAKANERDHNYLTKVKNVDFPSFFLEYSYGGDHLGLTVGLEHIFGEHSIGSGTRTDEAVATAAGGAENDTGTRTAKAEVKNVSTFYLEPTFMLNDMFGVFLKGGVTHMDVTSIETLKTSAYGDEEVLGGKYGYGLKVVSPYGAFLKLESTTTNFGTVTFQSTAGNENRVKAKPELESTRLSLGWNF